MDREKVINGLRCIKGDLILCVDCAYSDENGHGTYSCKAFCANDAIELLKKQQHKIWELNEINEYLDDVKKDQEHQIDVLKEQFDKDIIVRCKDCIHKNGLNHCPHNNDIWVADNWFCADGERQEGR